MAEKRGKTTRQRQDTPREGRVRLSKGVREHIRRLKAAGREDEAMALQRAEIAKKLAAKR